MVCEALGLGPQYYCIMRFINPRFVEQVFLLIQFLPHHKMYFYPNFGLPLLEDRLISLLGLGK